MRVSNGESKEACNVLLVDQGLSFGGALVVLLSIARNLSQSCSPVILTAIRDDPTKWIDTGDVPVYSCCPKYTYVDSFQDKVFAQKIPVLALKKLYIYWSSAKGFLLNIGYTVQIYRLIKRHNVRVVHANGSVFVALAAALARAQCLWHIHLVPSQPLSFWERILQPWIGKYISISDYVTRAAIAQGYPGGKLVTLNNPVADAFINKRPEDLALATDIRDKEGIGKEDFLVAVFGRIIKWKGQLEIVRAFGRLSDRPDIKLILVGDSSEGFDSGYKEQIEYLVASLGLKSQVKVTGFVRDVCSYYQAADLILHSSIEPEPFGLVVLEAMASAKPVIVSNLGAPPELVDAGKDGIVIDPTDTALMAATIRLLADDRDRCVVMGEAGLAKVRDHFMPSRYGNEIESLYRGLLND